MCVCVCVCVCVYFYVSSHVSGRYSRYFSIPCLRRVDDEVGKQTKIDNSSYLSELARKVCLTGFNKKCCKQQVEELLHKNNVSEWLAK